MPLTLTALPTAAAGGGDDEVKTKIPSEVFGSASYPAVGVCRKKPLLLTPVTMPVVLTRLPASGEVEPLPWIV